MVTRYSSFKYLCVLTVPIIAWTALNSAGLWTYLTVVQVFVLIPLLEFFIKPDESNLDEVEEEMMRKDRFYDLMLYLMLPVLYGFLYLFLKKVSSQQLPVGDLVGHTLTMGILCGALGINVAHELGHRPTSYEKLLSKTLLLCSLYMHFFIEHNRGHHKNVSTEEDPASAKYGESLFFFWFRSIFMGYVSAWKIESNRLKKKGINFFSIRNEMLMFQIIQMGFLLTIYLLFGAIALIFFAIAALAGVLQLETVNYIEHYGLHRNKTENGNYERVMPFHSWNSNHVIGRVMLFELSRHSDHHYLASRKYQILRHHEGSPQMPTGYPGMMVLATLPPVWFYIMNRRIKKIQTGITKNNCFI